MKVIGMHLGGCGNRNLNSNCFKLPSLAQILVVAKSDMQVKVGHYHVLRSYTFIILRDRSRQGLKMYALEHLSTYSTQIEM